MDGFWAIGQGCFYEFFGLDNLVTVNQSTVYLSCTGTGQRQCSGDKLFVRKTDSLITSGESREKGHGLSSGVINGVGNIGVKT